MNYLHPFPSIKMQRFVESIKRGFMFILDILNMVTEDAVKVLVKEVPEFGRQKVNQQCYYQVRQN
jgi:hypothetical protein